jgi:hypothetical protein
LVRKQTIRDHLRDPGTDDRPKCRWENNIKMDFEEIVCEDVD